MRIQVDELMRTCRKFFELPHDVKMKYIQQPGENAGYRKMGTQTFESDKPSDLRESFDIFPSSALDLAVFDKAHSEIGKSGYTGLRCLYYPAVPNIADLYSADIKANQMRCGQHSDWGTITLLFQDTTGGLEVLKPRWGIVEVNP
ncbi:PREDICTED: uncharacterized protein LOC106806400 [Priapulus caudatus]|uniref:Uncharacterized protein LOC106806400 n=1 Tax=Priapulus caudatus TaxID=37621 RepID=A0ABM1DV40_PRICU|nr:PREDICTED: uncharacterized protein LOC106806400 [Priapulus caudatus]